MCKSCDISQRVSNYYTVKGQFFAFYLEKNYSGQKKFTQTPSVVSVTNMRYAPGGDMLASHDDDHHDDHHDDCDH